MAYNAGSIGTFNLNHIDDGSTIVWNPSVILRDATAPGMGGDLFMWDNYRTMPSQLITWSFMARASVAAAEVSIATMAGTLPAITLNYAGGSRTGVGKVLSVIPHVISGLTQDGTDTALIVQWSVVLSED